MLRPTTYKRIISVRLYLRLAATNRQGFCPVRLTARWHGEELQVNTGELVLPKRLGKGGEVEELWHDDSQSVLDGRKLTEKEKDTVPTHPDTATNINARLRTFTKDVTDGFKRLYDLAPGEKVTKAALVVVLLPEARPAAPALAPAKVVEARTFREVLEEWKGENRNLAKDSLRKYDQLATMMESWLPSAAGAPDAEGSQGVPATPAGLAEVGRDGEGALRGHPQVPGAVGAAGRHALAAILG